MNPNPPLLLLGCGFLGTRVAELAMSAGRAVVATTRSPAHASRLQAKGISPRLFSTAVAERFEDLSLTDMDVLVTFPPDGVTDAILAPRLRTARALAYVSSTAVYGATRGHIDHHTPPAPNDERGQRRLEAENVWRSVGARILRVPAIYGPGRGLHLRLQAGQYQLPGHGTRHVSRIHVDDLARLCLAALARGTPKETYLVGDLAPCTHAEIATWLSEKLGVSPPQPGPVERAPRTLQGDRQIDPRAALQALKVTLSYPDYRSGYRAVLDIDRPPHPGAESDQSRSN